MSSAEEEGEEQPPGVGVRPVLLERAVGMGLRYAGAPCRFKPNNS
jgi:hypothetical protein